GAQTVVLSPFLPRATVTGRRDPRREVQDRINGGDRSPNSDWIEKVELQPRRRVDLMARGAQKRQRRPAEDTASARCQDPHYQPRSRPSSSYSRRFGSAKYRASRSRVSALMAP